MGKILITGASGHLGKEVTEFLLQKTDAANIKVLVRNASKAEVFGSKGVEIAVGDYDDHASLLSAFKDVDKLYFVSGTDIENRTAQQEGVVKAAKEAGVKHIVYTSYQRKTESVHSPVAVIADSHLHTEKLLKESGMVYTILQDGLYAEVIPNFAGHQLLETKTIFLPAGEGKTAFAVRSDMAEASAIILLDETGKFDNKSVEIAGSEAVTWKEIAKIISGITGESISYAPLSEAGFTELLTKAGVPALYIGMQVGFGKAIEAGEFDNVNGELEAILGRKPVTVEAYLRGFYGKEVVN
jgi:NAD(P)H dehydrogenase (quinone)